MFSLEVLLPMGLLVLAFLLKLFVDQSATMPQTIEVLYEMPVEVIFLATSFAIAYTLSSPTHTGRGLLYLLGFIGAAVIIVALWRRSSRLFFVNRYVLSAFVFVANIAISTGLLVSSIRLLSEPHQ